MSRQQSKEEASPEYQLWCVHTKQRLQTAISNLQTLASAAAFEIGPIKQAAHELDMLSFRIENESAIVLCAVKAKNEADETMRLEMIVANVSTQADFVIFKERLCALYDKHVRDKHVALPRNDPLIQTKFNYRGIFFRPADDGCGNTDHEFIAYKVDDLCIVFVGLCCHLDDDYEHYNIGRWPIIS